MEKTQGRWRTEFDILKLLAIFGVIYNHETMRHLIFSSEAWIHAVLNGLCKTAVPLFFMISGALLLGRDIPLPKQLRRIFTFIMAAIIATAIQLTFCTPTMWNNIFTGVKHSVATFAKNSYLNEWFAMWYLYAYLAILAFLPVLRCVAKSMDKNTTLYLLVLSIVVTGLLPMGYAVSGMYDYREIIFMHLPFVSTSDTYPFSQCVYIFYMLLGFGIDRFFQADISWRKAACGLLIIIGCFSLSWGMMHFVSYKYSTPLKNSNYFQCAFIAPVCVVLFIAVKGLVLKASISPRATKVLKTLGASVMFVFLFENIFRVGIAGHRDFFESHMSPYFASLSISVISWMSALSVGCVLRFIPGVRRIM